MTASVPTHLVSPETCLINVTKSFLGTALLLVANAFSKVGFVCAFFAFTGSFIVQLYCILLVVRVKADLLQQRPHVSVKILESDADDMEWKETAVSSDTKAPVRHPEVRTYSDVARAVWGKWGAFLVDISIIGSQYCVIAAYFTFLSDNLHTVFGVNRTLLKFLCCSCACGLVVLVPTLRRMGPFSAGAIILLSVGYVIIGGYTISSWRSTDDSYSWSFPREMDWLDFFQALSIFTYTFEGIPAVMSNQESIRDKSKFPRVVTIAMGVYFLVATFLGAGGYASYGRDTKQTSLDDLPGGRFADATRFLMCIGGIVSFPLMLWPNVEREEQALRWDTREFRQQYGAFPTYMRRFSLRVGSMLGCLGFALLVPDFELVAALVGALFSALLAIIIPAGITLTYFKNAAQRQRILWWVLLVLGIAASTACTIVALYNIGERLSRH